MWAGRIKRWKRVNPVSSHDREAKAHITNALADLLSSQVQVEVFPYGQPRRWESQRDSVTQPRVARNELPWGVPRQTP